MITLSRRHRRWSTALLVPALALIAVTALVRPAAAQDGIPLPPHWFWGAEFEAFEGAEVRAVAVDGEELGSATVEQGQWLLYLSSDDGRMLRFHLITTGELRLSRLYRLQYGELTLVHLSDFGGVQATESPTIRAWIVARLLDNGQIEFGVRDASDSEILPDQRRFPTTTIANRWLHSSVIELGGSVRGRIIARRLDSGVTEFGFRISGYDDFLPERRFFPEDPGHGRWLRSSPIEIPRDE